MDDNQKKFVTPILTKKRYANISEKVSTILEGDIGKTALVLKALCEETKFDPELKKYTPEDGVKQRESRNRLAKERGISIYELNNAKKYYEEKKKRVPLN